MSKTTTITFCERAENHVGMQKLGVLLKKGEGFTFEDLNDIKTKFEKNADCEMFDLVNLGEVDCSENAYILVIRNGLDV